ncbi:DNA polymerase sliding clamp subunit [Opitutaceae bacterium TAV1]|nr:DNA polymerase sliding clamp subunit [Opitutaceae bacterium TAV1]
MISFTIPFAKLRAAVLFASQDETRYVLCGVHVERRDAKRIILVATDGRRLATILHQVDDSLPEFRAFTIPAKLIREADITVKGRAFEALAYDLDEDQPNPWRIDENAIVTLDGETVSLAMSDGITYSAEDIEQKKDYPKFPKWSQSLDAFGRSLTPRASISLGAYLLGDFCRAATILHPQSSSLIITGYGQLKDDDDNPACYMIGIPAEPAFLGVLMPVKVGRPAIIEKPDWL